MQIDHIGIAVRSIEEAASRLCDLFGYSRATAPVTNSRQKVTVLFLRKAGSMELKLIEPSQEDSPLWPFVKRGGGLHHLAFKVPEVEQGCRQLEEKGVRVLAPPAPGEAFDGKTIAFCYAGFGLNIELVDTDARRALLDASGIVDQSIE